MGTSTAAPSSASTSAAARVDFPAPGGPVIPRIRRRPGTMSARARAASGARSYVSIRESVRADAVPR